MGYTERWKGVRKLTRSIDDKGVITHSGERVWDVDSVYNEQDAIDAVPDAALGAGHPNSAAMTVSANSGVEERKGLWAVTANYTETPPGGDTGSNGGIPQVEFNWEEGTMSFQADTDIDGNPLVNSALDPFEGGGARDVETFFYSVSIYQPFFDAIEAAGYRGRVGTDELVTPFGTFSALAYKCVSYSPVEAILPRQDRIKVRYQFEIRLKSEWPDMPEQMSPFDFCFVDQGEHGWGDDGKAHNIVDPAYPFSPKSARLNGNGIPFDQNDAVLQNKTTTKEIGPPTGALVMARTKCNSLYFKACKRKQMSGLNLPTHT